MEVSLVYLLKTMDASLNETVQRFSTVVVSVAAFLIVGDSYPNSLRYTVKTKTCHGISRLFLLFDILGGVLTYRELDVVSSISYVGVVVLDIAIWVIGTFVYGF
ncbi:hypothetical protein BC829DRAFT_408528 [Chytridium lagenaria]|nr:hypothetical protein BC829DRAFT_408528 [Chytridium lagenaria]